MHRCRRRPPKDACRRRRDLLRRGRAPARARERHRCEHARGTLRPAEEPIRVERLVGVMQLERRDLRLGELSERRLGEVCRRRGLHLGEACRRPLTHELGGLLRRDDAGIERRRAVDMVGVPVAEHDIGNRRVLLGRSAQSPSRGERDVRVEDQRLAAEIDEAGVADRHASLLRDRREDAVRNLLDLRRLHAVLRSCSRRRMIGFASLTISSR
jgi:hypothetical protein